MIGAGIAGLSAAYELKTAGHDVVVFESDNHVGGRMSTRIKDGFAFDLGANFYVTSYTNTRAYCDRFNIPFLPMPGTCYCTKQGELKPLTLQGLGGFLKYDIISLKSRIKLLLLFARMAHKIKSLDFFDLSRAPKSLDYTNAYDFARKKLGQYTADYLVDGFTSTYQFHRSREISTTAMLSLIALMSANKEGFTISHAKGEMSGLAEALARQVKVNLNTQVTSIESKKDKVQVKTKSRALDFDIVILATTADVARNIYKNPSKEQSLLLDAVRYSTTINTSFRIPKDALKGLSIITVPFVESSIISEYTNEANKTVKDGMCLVNVGLHEAFAKTILDRPDKEVYATVQKELRRVCPKLKDQKLIPHDIQRWPQAIPKYMQGFITKVKEFEQNGQGHKNVYFCGDYMNAPWVEGTIISAKKVAKLIK